MGNKRFSRKAKFNRTNIERVPDDKPGVYKIFNNKGENIYTGVAKKGRLHERLAEHLRGGVDPIAGGAWCSVKQKPLIQDARLEEKQIIKNEKPKHNKTS